MNEIVCNFVLKFNSFRIVMILSSRCESLIILLSLLVGRLRSLYSYWLLQINNLKSKNIRASLVRENEHSCTRSKYSDQQISKYHLSTKIFIELKSWVND